MPEFLIDVWLVAMDLGLSILQDTFFDACLDCFEQLPIEKLTRLEHHNLKKLLNNVNISSTKENMQNIWMKINKVNIISTYNTLELKCNIILYFSV